MRLAIVLILVSLLSGCGFGPHVDNQNICTKRVAIAGHSDGVCQEYSKVWECWIKRPIFVWDNRVAQCDTKEECNKICSELRK